MHLSIALAIHDEENNIVRCLSSVYDWADEIVIVDGGSTDKTIDLIKSLDTKGIVHIFTEPNVAMFHINKQKAIERCSKDWILQLDADEVVSPELKEEIIQMISSKSQLPSAKQITNPNDQIIENLQFKIAFWLPRLNYFLGKPLKKGGQYPDYTIRLYRNGVARFPCKSVHEQVEIIPNNQVPITNQNTHSNSQKDEASTITNSLNIENSIIDHLKAPLLHYPYPTFDAYVTKWKRYALLEADILNKQGIHPSFAHFVKYMIIYPKLWFFKTYVRHRGYADGFAGFVFCLFSALRFIVTYVALYELSQEKQKEN